MKTKRYSTAKTHIFCQKRVWQRSVLHRCENETGLLFTNGNTDFELISYNQKVDGEALL